MPSRGQTTKTTYPRACRAIRAGRYRVEFVGGRSTSGSTVQAFVVLVGPRRKVAHETNGAGKALGWIEDRETPRPAT